jgi:hypothetical protein
MSFRIQQDPVVKPATITVMLSVAINNSPVVATVWSFPSGNVQQVELSKHHSTTELPTHIRDALTQAWQLFDKLRRPTQ